MNRLHVTLRCHADKSGKRHKAHPNAGQISSAPQEDTKPSIHSPANRPATLVSVATSQNVMRPSS